MVTDAQVIMWETAQKELMKVRVPDPDFQSRIDQMVAEIERKICGDSFGDRLAYKLRQTGITQADFASRCDIDPGSMSRYINSGAYPRFEVVIKIAQELNVSIDWLVFGKR